MSVIGSNILAGTAAQAGDFELDQSLRFEDGDSPELVRSVTVAGNRRTSTWSAWVKIGWSTFSNDSGTIEPTHTLFCCGNSDARWNVGFSNATATNNNLPQLFIGQRDSGGSQAFEVSSTQAFRDPSSWYHIVVVMDTTQSTNTDRVKAYVNGERITDWGVTSFPSQNYDSDVFRTADPVVKVRVGSTVTNSNTGDRFWDGYIAEVHVVDGTALDASYFGETKATTGQWIPKKVSGVTYGTNGFYLPFSSVELANSFTDSSKMELTFTPTETLSVDVLLVGGGGGGQSGFGGGGGGGGIWNGTSHSVSAQNYSVVVGTGGQGGSAAGSSSAAGGNTTFDGKIAYGGGGTSSDRSGGSGQGAGEFGAAGSSTQTDQGGTGYGNAGGTMYSSGSSDNPGGGGGAGAVGGNGSASKAGDGGAGQAFTITGSSVTYGGGGGGGSRIAADDEGSGGSGGGGNGAGDASETAGNGTDGLGGGGGGGGQNAGAGSQPASAGGNGGSGIAIIRYASTTAKASGGTITSYTDGGTTYQVHSFTYAHDAHTITANGDVANTRTQSKIGNSSIYFDGTGDYLSTASSGMGLTGDYTIECWFNTASSTSDNGIISNKYNNSSFNGNFSLRLNDGGNSNDIAFRPYNGTVAEGGLVTSGTGAWSDNTWTHVAVVRSGSGTGNVKMYINGSLAGTSSGASSSTILGNAGDLNIGRQESASAGTNYLNGYMDEIRISNSARYTGSFTPTTTAFTADANTLLLIHSDFNGGLGSDGSGNKNDFAPTNLVVTDQVLDSPTLNYCTLNPVDGFNSMTATEGNLRANTNSGNDPKINATFQIPQSGKWYWEFVDQHGLSIMVGVIDQTNSGNIYGTNNSVIYSSGLGTKYNFSSVASYGASWTTGDIIGVAINRDDNEITFYKNNSSQGTFTIGGTAAQRARLIPVMGTGTTGTGGGTFNFGQDSSFHGTKTAQGNGDDGEDFYYTPPTGYKALNSSNLDDPAIDLPTAHFNTVLYTGNGGNLTVDGVGFSADLTWLKNRVTARNHNLTDTVRGVNKYLSSDTTDDERTGAGVQSWTADGFTLGSGAPSNDSGDNYASWNWKAGGSASSIGTGSITSSVSANTTNGFAIAGFVGNATDGATFGHGLSQKVEFAIVKSRDSASKPIVWYEGLSDTQSLELSNGNAIQTSGTPFWDTTSMSASLFALGNNDDSNKSGDNFIAWMWHSVEGYSKVGSYEGNANADGPFVYTGFKPAFVIIKGVDQAGSSWFLMDNNRDEYNVVDKELFADSSSAEGSGSRFVDFNSNGFKLRANDALNYASTMLYYAVAESPFKTANAR